ncbi:cytochrome P450 [Ruegeria arenilitoris]|uniref:cytochrome P450 n=1 Tax=Ruegeria arenilitoris TaxID=1173585 RepID=UPI00147E6B3F|nr:cytochrome P450 [Ruegeria arenilitoris]
MLAETESFEPVTVKPIQRNASAFSVLRKVMQNPVEGWPDSLYEDFIFEKQILGNRVVLTSDPEIVKGVLLSQQSDFPKPEIAQSIMSRSIGKGLLTAEGAEWKFLRKATAPVFQRKSLSNLLPHMIAVGKEVAQQFRSNPGEIDVLPSISKATFETIANTLLSGEEDNLDYERISNDVHKLLAFVAKVDPLDLFEATRNLPKPWARAGVKAAGRLREDAMKALSNRRKSDNATDDLLSLLLAAQDPETGKKLSEIELRDNIVTFIGAGRETTSHAIAWTFYLLANSPFWQDQLVDELSEVLGEAPLTADNLGRLKKHEMVLKEAMRLYPPCQGMHRVAAADVEINGLKLRKGDMVFLATYPMHRHKKLWERPNHFEPRRFDAQRMSSYHRFQYIPFSAGPRICSGLKYAMFEATAILASVVRTVRLAPVEGFVPYPNSRITLHAEGGMKLRVSPRH